jgi:hypothetical protein
MSIAAKKQAASKSFQSKLNSENKAAIERILDSVDSSSCYSGGNALSGLESILGRESAVFLLNLLDAFDFDRFTKDLKDISSETKAYIEFLYSVYSYRLRGILSGQLSKVPNEWVGLQDVSARYDIDSKTFYLKFEIQKMNKECVILEDTPNNIVTLATLLIKTVTDLPSRCLGERRDLGVPKNAIEAIKRTVQELEKVALKDK